MSITPRPVVHFTPDTGWLNDPHGIYHDGDRYHLFFQHVPDSLEWRSDVQWGHATSKDLLHWQWEPAALLPGDGDDGCWSGGAAIDDDGNAVLFYTATSGPDHQVARIRTARLSESGDRWIKGDVVVTSPDPSIRLFRDPMVLRDGEHWRMVVGAGTTDGTAQVSTFVSTDLETWAYDGVLAARNTKSQHPWTGTGWECPQLIPGTGDEPAVLMVSIWDNHVPHDVAATTGTYKDGRFTPHRWRLLTKGQTHFAATTFTDIDGNTCVIFWVRGTAEPGVWSGALSIPYVLTTEAEELQLSPHPAITAARVDAPSIPAAAIDIEWKLQAGHRLTLEGTDGRAHAVIEAGDGRISISVPDEQAPVDVAHAATRLRIIADTHLLEVVADGGLVGLPLPATGEGLHPIATDSATIRWWHLI